MNTAIKTYAVIVTIAIIIVLAWRSGYKAGQHDAVNRVDDVLNETSSCVNKTWDAMVAEFRKELE